MAPSVVSNLLELVRLVSPGGTPNPAVPPEMAGMLHTCVREGVKVLVIEGKAAWMLVLSPRKKDDGCALAHLYKTTADGSWDAWALVIDPNLGCTTIVGQRVENLDKLEGIS